MLLNMWIQHGWLRLSQSSVICPRAHRWECANLWLIDSALPSINLTYKL